MSAVLLTAPAAEPLSLADAKNFVRVEHDDDDAIITSLIASASNHVEALTRCLWGFRFGVLGVYVSGRTREKMSLATGLDTPSVLDRVLNKVVKKK